MVEKHIEKTQSEFVKWKNDSTLKKYIDEYFDIVMSKIVVRDYLGISKNLSDMSDWNISKDCLVKYLKTSESAYGELQSFIQSDLKIEIIENTCQNFICTYRVDFSLCSGEARLVFKMNEGEIPKLDNIQFSVDTNMNLPFFDQLSQKTFALLAQEDYKTIFFNASRNYRSAYTESYLKETLSTIPTSAYSQKRLFTSYISKRKDCCQLQFEIVYTLRGEKKLLVTYLEEGQNIKLDEIRILN